MQFRYLPCDNVLIMEISQLETTLKDLKLRVAALESAVMGYKPAVDTKAQTDNLADMIGGEEGLKEIKKSKTLKEAIYRIKSLKAKTKR